MRLKSVLFAIALQSTVAVWAADGDMFTAKTAEGVDMTFTVISEENKTCKVGRKPEPMVVAYASIDRYTSGSITIPATVNGYTVTKVGDFALLQCGSLTSVNIPSTVTTIGANALGWCSGLVSINIPSSVTTIGERAFEACSRLTSITIPANVTNIGMMPFFGCLALKSIVVSEDNGQYDSRGGCNAIIETETNELIAGCDYTVIPDDVTRIGSRALSGCQGLTSITIPASVRYIGDEAFSLCYQLQEVVSLITVPSAVDIPDGWALYHPVALYVPQGCVEAYRAASGWQGAFSYIAESDDSHVAVHAPTAAPRGEQAVYSLDGRKIKTPQAVSRGVYIENGRKVLR
ncbi:MAG: leucine-rich repeat domain-containing protein [Prevotella sp.]|nr:leucine-rich repeat domain-containing protein [Prevotella sp.]